MRDPEVALSSKVYENLRVVLIFEDPTKAENFAARMRAQGAQVAAVAATNTGLQTAAELDPAVLIVNSAPDGSAYNVRRAIRRNNRLRWASLLSILPEDLWGKDGQGGTALDALAERLATCVEADRKIERLCVETDTFELSLAEAGPSRTLRAISRASGTRTAIIKTPSARIEIDFTDGLVVSAQGELNGNEVSGETALRVVLRFGDALVTVEARERPTGTNVMLPIDEAFAGLEIEERRTEPPPALKAEGLLIDAQMRRSLKAPRLPTFAAKKTGTEDVLETAPTGRYPALPDIQSDVPSDAAPPKKFGKPEPKKKKRTLRRPSSLPRLGAYTAPAGFRSKSSLAPAIDPPEDYSDPLAAPVASDTTTEDKSTELSETESAEPTESIWDSEPVTRPFAREADRASDRPVAGVAPNEEEATRSRPLDLEGVLDFGFGEDSEDVTLPARPSSLVPPMIETPQRLENLDSTPSVITENSERDIKTDPPPPKSSKNWLWGILLLAAALVAAYFIYRGLPGGEAHSPQTDPEHSPDEQDPVETEHAPVDEAPADQAPVDQAPVDEAPVDQAPVDQAPVDEAPVDEAPVDEAPVDEAPVDEAPVDEAPVDEAPVELEEGLSDRARDRLSDEAARIAERAIRENNYALALRQTERALLIAPRNPQAIAARARYHLAREEAAQAVQWAERAVRRRSRRASYRLLLGDAYRLAGNTSEARRAWQRALELDSNNRTAASRLGR